MSPADPRRGTAVAEQRAAAPLQRPDPQTVPPQRHLRLVPRQSRFRVNRRRVVVGTVIAGASAMCFALVTLHVLIAENQFTLDRMQQQAASQQSTYEKLQLQVAQLEAPARIVSLAEGRLGLVQPASVTYLPAVPASTRGAGSVSAGPQGSGPSASGPADRSSSGTTVPAPTGDADWPGVKPYLSGTP